MVVLVAIATGVFIKLVWLAPRPLDCARASLTAPEGIALDICKREYERTRVPFTGAYYADLLRRSGGTNIEPAVALANDLLSTEVRGDALQILGKIAMTQKRFEDALRLLQDARRLHRERADHRELARDNQALGRVYTRLEQYAEALHAIDECISEARTAGDDATEGSCRITAADAYTNAGYFEAAGQELDRAAPQFHTDRDRAQLWLERGNLEQEVVRGPLRVGHNEQAIAAFERSLELAKRGQISKLILTLHLNLAFSLAEVGRTDEADRHLAEGALHDQEGKRASERAQLAARIAYRRGDLTVAYSANTQLYRAIDDRDEQIDVSVMQARIALQRNDLEAAVTWAQRGVESAEQVRAVQTMSELRPWVLASRREPFELLFTALARAGRVEDAAVVFDQWQGRTLLDEMTKPGADPSPGLADTATRVQSLRRWIPAVSRAPLMTSNKRAVIDTLRTIDLVALVVADGDIWRLAAGHGRPRLDNLGSFEALRDRLDRFVARPTEARLAGELGPLILPIDLLRKTSEPLYVVLDAQVAALPVVALRSSGLPLIAIRPVLRAPRLPAETPCTPRVADSPPSGVKALVLADAAGDLPDARRESSIVASLFNTTALVGAAATSTALFAAKSDPLLHVAVHADVDARGGILKLHDRAVSAAEISANRLGPALVVLSACSTASAWDPELAGSLSTAFLSGGSQRVVATLRPVSDAAALKLTSRFYNANGRADPVRVLAEIQAGLAEGDDKEWPNFVVFGNEACKQPHS